MLLKVNREIDRCKRVMRERVWPHIHQVLAQCTVGAVKNPGEPEMPAAFITRAVSGQVIFSAARCRRTLGNLMGHDLDTCRGTVARNPARGASHRAGVQPWLARMARRRSH